MGADGNLLFGVLALQADLLTPARFAGACSAWAARKDAPLADLLVECGWLAAVPAVQARSNREPAVQFRGGLQERHRLDVFVVDRCAPWRAPLPRRAAARDAGQVGPLGTHSGRVLAGVEDGRGTWRHLQALNQLGVTRGTLQLL